jgi:hypothetical protein
MCPRSYPPISKRVGERHYYLTGVDVAVALCVQKFLGSPGITVVFEHCQTCVLIFSMTYKAFVAALGLLPRQFRKSQFLITEIRPKNGETND